MKKKTLLFVISWFLLFLCVTGCQLVKDETGTHIRLSPQGHKTIGDVGDSATGILDILSVFVPALIPVAAAATAGTAVWKKMGKKVTKYKTPLEHTVGVLEGLKKDEKLWKLVKPYLKGNVKDVWSLPSAKTEATIREIVDDNQGAT
jgi:hypothetical protein